MTTAELMAVAVLKGDMQAARALADHLCEQWAAGGVEVRAVKVGTGRIRCVFSPPPGEPIDYVAMQGLHESLPAFLTGQGPGGLVIPPGWRMDMYEFPADGGAA